MSLYSLHIFFLPTVYPHRPMLDTHEFLQLIMNVSNGHPSTGWRTKCHTIDFARNTLLLLQKHLTSGTELILIGWKIFPNEEHNLSQTNPCIRHNFSTQVFRKRAAQLHYVGPELRCVRFAGCCSILQTGHINLSSTPDQRPVNQSAKYHRQQPLYNTLDPLMMGIVLPETS